MNNPSILLSISEYQKKNTEIQPSKWMKNIYSRQKGALVLTVKLLGLRCKTKLCEMIRKMNDSIQNPGDILNELLWGLIFTGTTGRVDMSYIIYRFVRYDKMLQDANIAHNIISKRAIPHYVRFAI